MGQVHAITPRRIIRGMSPKHNHSLPESVTNKTVIKPEEGSEAMDSIHSVVEVKRLISTRGILSCKMCCNAHTSAMVRSIGENVKIAIVT